MMFCGGRSGLSGKCVFFEDRYPRTENCWRAGGGTAQACGLALKRDGRAVGLPAKCPSALARRPAPIERVKKERSLLSTPASPHVFRVRCCPRRTPARFQAALRSGFSGRKALLHSSARKAEAAVRARGIR